MRVAKATLPLYIKHTRNKCQTRYYSFPAEKEFPPNSIFSLDNPTNTMYILDSERQEHLTESKR